MGEILAYKDQQIVVGKERPLGENRVEVDTKVISEKTETPINFRLIFKNNQWWCYDFVIENISVVADYRSRFGRILAKDSIEKMLEDLRAKAAERPPRWNHGPKVAWSRRRNRCAPAEVVKAYAARPTPYDSDCRSARILKIRDQRYWIYEQGEQLTTYEWDRGRIFYP